MHSFPAHVPILECGGAVDHRLIKLTEALVKQMRVARIDGTGVISPLAVSRLLIDHDLILVENKTRDHVPFPSIPRLSDLLHESDFQDPTRACEQIAAWLTDCRRQTPVFGAVLIGGRSSRMGHPKHLLQGEDGRSWLEHLISLFEPFVAEQVVSGAGELPDSMAQIERVEDLDGVAGPLAGIGALLRGRPFVSWLVCACDMPHITPAAIQWLLEQRDHRYTAVIPRNPDTGRREPLFAWYDYRCRTLVDDLIVSGSSKISDLCSHPTIFQPGIPASQSSCWQNINYPDQL